MKNAPREIDRICWQSLGAELVFTQDCFGNYLSFFWQNAQKNSLDDGKTADKSEKAILIPREKKAYQEILNRVLARSVPEKCYFFLEYGDQSFPFELVISPILPPQGKSTTVLVIGRHCQSELVTLTSSHGENRPEKIAQKLLIKIGRQLRRSLDLETIRLKTVDSLGEVFEVSRCLLLSYDEGGNQLKVEAEYCQAELLSMLGCLINVENEPYLQQAIASGRVVMVDWIVSEVFEEKSILAVATYYQNQPNGLICLQQCDRYRDWDSMEIELLEELADQVGTAIAHATIYRELKQAKTEAEEASRLKSDFLASTSHELRTPLNGIIGFLKLILEDLADNPEEQGEFIQEAYRSSLHLLNLINDILDIAKIEAGKMELDFAPVVLNELFENLENFARSQAAEKQLNFQLKLPLTYEPIIIYGNYQRLLQVMFNLVSNAIKFTHKGGITVNAEIVQKTIKRHGHKFPGMVKIGVADTGIGVSLEQQDKLFQKFFQVYSGRTREYGGTGLGLAISHKLVEAMGGKMSFYSMGEGLGSTVTFTVLLNEIPIIKTTDS